MKSYRTVRAGLDARMVKPTAAKPRRDRGVVYFVRFRDRIKIGFTTDLRRRLTDLPYHEVLLTQDGTMADEQRCHALFAHLRDVGEWFRAERDLLDFIEGCKH